MMTLLTVTIPCYNSQDYMEKCIKSLLPGGDRIQIVIVDDGSKDETGKIADKYKEMYPDIITVVHQENGGHGEGINQGIKNARGKYFKVVDSDDWVSDDITYFLDTLEKCEAEGGVDLVVTNYYYEHADGKGNRSINYSNVFPKDKIVTWKDTKKFKIEQLLTLHSSTFNTELFKKYMNELPKHIFYEDNLMVYQLLPYVNRMIYLDIDFYRYFIGRDGQSVQKDVMMRRYEHQLIVTEKCFKVCHLDEVKEPMLRKYLAHELFMMFGISVLYARLNKSMEADTRLSEMWAECAAYDEKWEKKLHKHTPIAVFCIPGKFGQNLSSGMYNFANKVVRFN